MQATEHGLDLVKCQDAKSQRSMVMLPHGQQGLFPASRAFTELAAI